MKCSLQSCASSVFVLVLVLASAMTFSQRVCAECTEMKIVEYEDRIEAVCVGEPLTEAQKKANMEEEKRQEAANKRQRNEEEKRQRDADAASKAQAVTDAAERKKREQPSAAQQKPATRNAVTPKRL